MAPPSARTRGRERPPAAAAAVALPTMELDAASPPAAAAMAPISVYHRGGPDLPLPAMGGDWVLGPPLFPTAFDWARRMAIFGTVDAEVFHDAPFHLSATIEPTRWGFNLDDLIALQPQRVAKPAHFILMSAFCSSTLLARCLQLLPGCMTLKEPSALGHLSFLRHETDPARMPGGHWQRAWHEVAHLTLDLLAVCSSQHPRLVVKAADITNSMADVIARHDSRSRIILLSSGLRQYILSVLKSASRRQWARARFDFWRREALYRADVPILPVDADFDAAKAAAYIWLMNMLCWRAAGLTASHPRVLALDGDAVAGCPVSALLGISTFFSWPAVNRAQLEATLAASGLLGRHSKRKGLEYDVNRKAEEFRMWERFYGGAADTAIAWAWRLCAEQQVQWPQRPGTAGDPSTAVNELRPGCAP